MTPILTLADRAEAGSGPDRERIELRPMETAPRNGSEFWGIVDGSAIKMFFHEGFGEFITGYRRMTLATGLTFAETGLNYRDHSPEIERPTAWMPIPAALLRAIAGGVDG